MKIFVLGVPHTQTTVEFTTCAFTMKVWNLCKMLTRRGHQVIHLGTEGSNPVCTEHVSVTSLDLWKKFYGHPGTANYDTDMGEKKKPYMDAYIKNSQEAINCRVSRPYESIICVPWAGPQKTVVEGLVMPQNVVESGIGYMGTFANFRVYESYAWLHMHMGKEGKFEGKNFYQVVIPNAFDPEMFGPVREWKDKSPDFLCICRLNHDKGISQAIQVAKALGRKIKIVGQGDPKPYLEGNPHVTYLPPVGVEERKKLMSEARAVFCLTHFVEPFCGVNVEAQLSGAPVITTDWGVFPETVMHGYTGFRCRTFEHMIWAAKNIEQINPTICREWAVRNFSIDRVALMYEEYFMSIMNVAQASGWPLEHPGREQLDWLKRSYPGMADPINLNIKFIPPNYALTPQTKPVDWKKENEWESKWWGLNPSKHWDVEVEKQKTYARLMGLSSDLDVENKRILDVGCGPVSMMLRSKQLGKGSVGVDPLPVSDKTKARYAKAGIAFINMKAEEMSRSKSGLEAGFDEVWDYNCLQHVEDPIIILKKMAEMAPVIRLFEWINLDPCPGHPWKLIENMFSEAFPPALWNRLIWNRGFLGGFGGSIRDEYLAIHVVKKS